MGYGPTILGVAVTNRPNIRLRGNRITYNEQTGEYRIPFMIAGKYRYSKTGETLVYNDQVMDKMLENWEKGVFDGDVTLDSRHHPDAGALMFLEKDKGGRIAKETSSDGRPMLVAYGKPVSDRAREIISGFSMASVEYHPDYTSLKLMDSDFGDSVVHGEDIFEQPDKETNMEKDIKQLEQALADKEQAYNELAEKAQQLEAKVNDLGEKLTAATAEVESLKSLEVEPEENEVAIPEEIKNRLVQLEQANAALLERERQATVRATIAKLSVPVDGKTYPAALLNVAQSIMLGEAIGDGTITLEQDDGTYYQQAIVSLIEAAGRTVVIEANTEGADDTNTLEVDDEIDDEHAKALWEVA